MGKRGPDPIQIDWDEFDRLISYQCTQVELADWFDCSVDTLDNACQRDRGEKLSDIWAKKKNFGKVRVRKAQFEIMESGGPGAATMAIFLGKQMLGQVNEPPNPAPPPPFATPKKLTFDEFCVSAGYPPPFPKQHEMRAWGIDQEKVRMILGARGYGKTDYVTVLGCAYAIYCDWFDWVQTGRLRLLVETNLIISKSKSRNAAMIAEIGAALTKAGVPLSVENSTCIRVAGLIGKDHSVEAVPLKASFRGRHPKRIFMDDPVTEEDTSDAMRILVKKKYDEAYKLSKNICVIGQPAHAYDLYADLSGIDTMRVPHGTIPELDADLDAMQSAGVDVNSIEMSYHLRIPKSGAALFSEINFVDSMPIGSTVAYLDPSDGGDYSALSIFRGYLQGIAVEGRAVKRAWYHWDELTDILIKAKVTHLAFETNKHGQQPIEQLTAILAPHGIKVVGLTSTTPKETVIALAGSFAHMIHLSKKSDKAYTDQVTRYEYKAKYDDAPDSLARGLIWLGLLKDKK